MRRRLPLLLGVLFVAAVASGCDGPQGAVGPQGEQGPQGPTGPQGPPGIGCSDCHAADAGIVAIQEQFMLSPHGFDQFELRGPDYAGGACVACHSHQGFIAEVTGEPIDWGAGVAPMNCRTCHRIHTGEGFALTTTDPVTLRVTGETVDLSGEETARGGNLCASCHQARERDWPDLAQDSFEITSSHYGVHYGPQANVYTALLAPVIEFGVDTEGTFSAHDRLACSGCHMGLGVEGLNPAPVAGGELHHNFEVSPEVCATCHGVPDGSGFDFDYENIQSDVAGMLADLGECLEAEGVIEIADETPALLSGEVGEIAALHGGDIGDLEYEPVVGTHPSGYVAAYLAFNALVEDGSMGVHQPVYARSLANAALDYMTANSDLCPVEEPAP